ncbi:MAG TPA: TolC family protein, partial [Kofleriaceae bacterium]|nr:TolC family protein [Kofleriaceae bacterium]
ADAARIGLFPQIAAIATVQESGGGGAFAEPFSWFVGLQASWNIWTWGREWKAVDAAGIRATQAALAADRLADRVAVEARNQARTARAAHDAIAVASTGLAAAEEAYRIQQARYAEGATTTTDLLSAETDVSRARIGYATARYSYMLELAKLARATGQLPSALLPVTR